MRHAKDYTGRFGWEDAVENRLIGSSEERTVGESSLACTWRFAGPAGHIAVHVGSVHISFGAGDKEESKSGVVIEVAADGKPLYSQSLLRSAGEDWVQSDSKILEWTTPARQVTLTLKLVDRSPVTGLRVDMGSCELRRNLRSKQ